MGFDVVKFLPQKVCFCLEYDPGVKILLVAIIIFRALAMILGCFYGPYIYAVLPLGGLYLAADGLLLQSVWGAFRPGGILGTSDEPERSEEDEVQCDFKTQRVWIFLWLIINTCGVLGLLTAIGLFADLGTWAMSHEPIHFVVFIVIILLSALLIYTILIVLTLYQYLKEAWIQGLLGGPWDDTQPGLTKHGNRVSVQ